jgi:hypothetical protein
MSCTGSGDSQLAGITNAFNHALERAAASACAGELEGELSNAMSHLYRLHELCKLRLIANWDAVIRSSPELASAEGATWVRNFDAHQVFAVTGLSDSYSDSYTNLFSVPIWKRLVDLPAQTDKHGRHIDYQKHLEGKPAFDTLRLCFGALRDLLA